MNLLWTWSIYRKFSTKFLCGFENACTNHQYKNKWFKMPSCSNALGSLVHETIAENAVILQNQVCMINFGCCGLNSLWLLVKLISLHKPCNFKILRTLRECENFAQGNLTVMNLFSCLAVHVVDIAWSVYSSYIICFGSNFFHVLSSNAL